MNKEQSFQGLKMLPFVIYGFSLAFLKIYYGPPLVVNFMD